MSLEKIQYLSSINQDQSLSIVTVKVRNLSVLPFKGSGIRKANVNFSFTFNGSLSLDVFIH